MHTASVFVSLAKQAGMLSFSHQFLEQHCAEQIDSSNV